MEVGLVLHGGVGVDDEGDVVDVDPRAAMSRRRA
jgi:hypothetical protein